MAGEGTKKTTAEKASSVELLEAEVKDEKVIVVINGVELRVNPKAVQSGPAMRAMMNDNGNFWPMYEVLVPDVEKQKELEATLPQYDYGYDLEDFAEMFQELFQAVAGKKA